MDHYAGIDVSLEYSSIGVVDAFGPFRKSSRASLYHPLLRCTKWRPWPIKGGEGQQVRNPDYCSGSFMPS